MLGLLEQMIGIILREDWSLLLQARRRGMSGLNFWNLPIILKNEQDDK